MLRIVISSAISTKIFIQTGSFSRCYATK